MNKPQVPAQMRANSSTVGFLGRLREIWSEAGVQFGGYRDLYEVFGWKRGPQYADFVKKYRTQDIAIRVINQPVKALWADPPVLIGDDVFNKAWADILAQVPVFHHVIRFDKLVGLGRYAVMVMGYDDGGSLASPVTMKPGRKLLYMQPYGEGAITIKKWDDVKTSPRFGLPVMYTINPGKFETEERTLSTSTLSQQTFDVHYTRVIHAADNCLESSVVGESRLAAIYNTLDDILKVTGGSAETYWLVANRGLHVNVDKEVDLDEEDAANLEAEIDEYSNQLRRTIRTRGVNINSLGSDVSDPRGTFDVLLSLLAAATGIPKRVLLGSEAGQLASQQDRANWAIQVAERRAEFAQPTILVPLVRNLIAAGALPAPSKLEVEWPDAFKMNPLERAQTSAQMARSATNLARMLQTIELINHNMAVDAQPTIIQPSGGGFFGNARMSDEDLIEMASGKTKTKEKKKPPAPKDTPPMDKKDAAPDAGGGEPIEQPPLQPTDERKVVLLTPEECRAIIGFGQHMPVFDEKKDTLAIISPKAGG